MLHNIGYILSELRNRLQSLYGDRLANVILYGSQARGEATEDSDIDVMVILKGDVSPSQEIARTIDDVADISLVNDVVLSCIFMPESRYEREQSPLLMNVRREGMAV
ncbi:MAG: nucleotidyltransferase domain-containing protein [Desulfuromonadales bacterium]